MTNSYRTHTIMTRITVLGHQSSQTQPSGPAEKPVLVKREIERKSELKRSDRIQSISN